MYTRIIRKIAFHYRHKILTLTTRRFILARLSDVIRSVISKVALKLITIILGIDESSLIRGIIYESKMSHLIANMPRRSNVPLTSIWPDSSFFYDAANNYMMQAELNFVNKLIEDISIRNIPGDVVEFGVYDGGWIEHLYASLENCSLDKKIFGFDSFQGLPRPNPADDLDCWVEGQYCVDYKTVYEKLHCEHRSRIVLIPGWFSDSITSTLASNIKHICYCRIDCDLYESAKVVLDFITDKLVNNSVLVFDEWTHDDKKGETKAFIEWAPKSGLQFEFLAHNSLGHLYLRVIKKS